MSVGCSVSVQHMVDSQLANTDQPMETIAIRAERILDAASEYMGIAPSEALSSRSREACTVRQFVAYVMVHKMGVDQETVATTLHITQGTVSRSVKLVRSYSGDLETRETAEAFVRHLYKFVV